MYLLGRKLKMSQIWQEKKVVPVTLIKVEPNTVSLVRTKERDGYEAVQVKSGRTKREFRIINKEEVGKFSKDQVITVAEFTPEDTVRITGTSKGRGFQGVVKRHGFHGGPKTHGQKNRFRAPGSIGNTAPQRVVPGRKMAGRMGGDRITIKSTKVVHVDAERGILSIKGATPGAPGGLLMIRLVKHGSEVKK